MSVWTPPPHIVNAALSVVDSPESWSCPPGHSGLWRKHLERVCDAIEAGTVTEAIALVNNATETAAFQRVGSFGFDLALLAGRVVFGTNGDFRQSQLNYPVQGQAVVYYGPHRLRFGEAFKELGALAWSPPAPEGWVQPFRPQYVQEVLL